MKDLINKHSEVICFLTVALSIPFGLISPRFLALGLLALAYIVFERLKPTKS